MEDVDKAVADAADKVLEMLRDGRQSHKRRRVLATLLGALVCLKRAKDYTEAIGDRTGEGEPAWTELTQIAGRIQSGGDTSDFGAFEAQLHYNSACRRLYSALDLVDLKRAADRRLAARVNYMKHPRPREPSIPVVDMPGVVRETTQQVLARLRDRSFN